MQQVCQSLYVSVCECARARACYCCLRLGFDKSSAGKNNGSASVSETREHTQKKRKPLSVNHYSPRFIPENEYHTTYILALYAKRRPTPLKDRRAMLT